MQFVLNGKPVKAEPQKYVIDWSRAVSKPQKAVKDFLYPYWKNHVCLEEFRIPRTLLRIDLLNLTRHIVVEVSPAATHREYNPHFHRGNRFNYLKTLKRDADKEAWAKENKFTFIEIYEDDIPILSPKWFEEKHEIIL
jgi:hypothetical protein